MKIVLNKCFGGFSLSKKAYRELGIKWDGYGFWEGERDDPKLVAVVEKLGKAASGARAALRIVEIPDGVKWNIADYDGMESVHEQHRVWS